MFLKNTPSDKPIEFEPLWLEAVLDNAILESDADLLLRDNGITMHDPSVSLNEKVRVLQMDVPKDQLVKQVQHVLEAHHPSSLSYAKAKRLFERLCCKNTEEIARLLVVVARNRVLGDMVENAILSGQNPSLFSKRDLIGHFFDELYQQGEVEANR